MTVWDWAVFVCTITGAAVWLLLLVAAGVNAWDWISIRFPRPFPRASNADLRRELEAMDEQIRRLRAENARLSRGGA